MPQLLRYATKPRIYQIDPSSSAYSEQAGAWLVRETFEPNTEPSLGAGHYRVVVEREFQERDHTSRHHGEVLQLAGDLDRLWAYVCGEPLFPVTMHLSLNPVPDHWETNRDEFSHYHHSPTAWLTGESKHWLCLPYFPLERVLRIRREYSKASESVRALIELHHAGLKSTGTETRFSLFAKALELARALIPGRDLKAKERSLSPDVQSAMRRPLKWLFEIGNDRFETRHVVRDPANVTLHPRLSSDEMADYRHDADLILRSRATEALGSDMIIIERAGNKD